MKQLLITIFILLCALSLIAKDNNLYVYQNGKVIGQFTPAEFKALVQGADLYAQELEAENKGLKIDIIDKPYKLESSGMYVCNFSIKWIGKTGHVLKEIKMQSEIQIPEGDNPMPEWRVKYREIAEIGFPAVTGVFALFVVLIIAL